MNNRAHDNLNQRKQVHPHPISVVWRVDGGRTTSAMRMLALVTKHDNPIGAFDILLYARINSFFFLDFIDSAGIFFIVVV